LSPFDDKIYFKQVLMSFRTLLFIGLLLAGLNLLAEGEKTGQLDEKVRHLSRTLKDTTLPAKHQLKQTFEGAEDLLRLGQNVDLENPAGLIETTEAALVAQDSVDIVEEMLQAP